MTLYPNDLPWAASGRPGIQDIPVHQTDIEDLAAWTEWHLRDRFPGRPFAHGQYRADALELEPLDTAVWHVGSKPAQREARPQGGHHG